MQPTRPEKEAWVKKKTPLCRWRRVLSPQESFKGSIFESHDELNVDAGRLAEVFEKQPDSPTKRRSVVEAEPVKQKDFLWIATEKQDPGKRRMNMAMLSRLWEKKADTFFSLLQNFQFQDIVDDPDFDLDKFDQLVDGAASIVPGEWERLDSEASRATYVWQDNVEGLFHKLGKVPFVTERLRSIKMNLDIQKESQVLGYLVLRVSDSIEAISCCQALKVLVRKVLCAGNHLNAGEAKFGRADGFDVVEALATMLVTDQPKGPSGVTLLEHLRREELGEASAEEFRLLGERLAGWKMLTGEEGEVDDADLGRLQDETEGLARNVGELETLVSTALQRSEGHADPGDLARLPLLSRFKAQVQSHCKRYNELSEAVTRLREHDLPRLQRYLACTPPPKAKGQDLSAGRILGVFSLLSKRMAVPPPPAEGTRSPRASLSGKSTPRSRSRAGSRTPVGRKERAEDSLPSPDAGVPTVAVDPIKVLGTTTPRISSANDFVPAFGS